MLDFWGQKYNNVGTEAAEATRGNFFSKIPSQNEISSKRNTWFANAIDTCIENIIIHINGSTSESSM